MTNESVNTRLSALRDLLAREMSPHDKWDDLCDLFDRWPDDEDLAVGLAYAESHLDLDDSYRVVPLDWLFDASNRVQPRLELGRSIVMGGALYHTDAWASRQLAGVRQIRLVRVDVRSHVGTLINAPCWPLLRSLALDHCGIDDEVFASLVDVDMDALEALDVSDNELTGLSIQRLTAGLLPSLRRLELAGNGIGDEVSAGISSFAGATLPRLTHLGLARTVVDDEGCLALAQADLPSLVSLDLSGNALTLGGMLPLLSTLAAGTLRSLNLSHASLDPRVVRALTVSPALTNVVELRLERTQVDDDQATAIARAGNLRALHTLDLQGNPIGPDGATALATSKELTSLTGLNLRDCRIGRRGQRALLDAGYVRSGQQLGLWLRH